jgi:hypothetical protein
MTDSASYERMADVLERAQRAALSLNAGDLASATGELTREASALRVIGARDLQLLRGQLVQFATTCRYLARTLADCFDAAAAQQDPACQARYRRHGAIEAAHAPALVLGRYG